MRVLAIFASLASLAAVSAQTPPPPCDTTLLLPLLTDPSLAQCTADSGLSLPPTAGSLTTEVLAKACKSQGCNALVTKVRALNVGDCAVGTFKLETDLLTPLKTACLVSGGSGAGSSAGATPTTTPPAAAQEEPPAATRTVPSPAPTTTQASGAAATVAASASSVAVVAVAVAAALW